MGAASCEILWNSTPVGNDIGTCRPSALRSRKKRCCSWKYLYYKVLRNPLRLSSNLTHLILRNSDTPAGETPGHRTHSGCPRRLCSPTPDCRRSKGAVGRRPTSSRTSRVVCASSAQPARSDAAQPWAGTGTGARRRGLAMSRPITICPQIPIVNTPRTALRSHLAFAHTVVADGGKLLKFRAT